MHDNGVTLQKKVLQNLDIPYSYELAKRMEQYRSHPTLGYRPAGSKAEFETGEMLKTEMEKIGLSEVTKDAVTVGKETMSRASNTQDAVDGWEFHKAALSSRMRPERPCQQNWEPIRQPLSPMVPRNFP